MKINVENIPCYVSIGIHDEEKKMGQKLLIDVTVEIDSSKATKTDDVSNTINYVDIYNTVQKTGKSKSYSLIETLAESVFEAIIVHPSVKSVKIKVHKPHIPFPEFQGNVSVEIERRKWHNASEFAEGFKNLILDR